MSETQRYAEELRQIEAAIFGRRGEGHVHPTNERMEALVELLGDPQRAYRSIHLTGTNGKTSTARMITQLLAALGLRVVVRAGMSHDMADLLLADLRDRTEFFESLSAPLPRPAETQVFSH